jgi:hypothetical protein
MIAVPICCRSVLGEWIVENNMQDESHLPVAEQSLIFRLRKRAEIRRQIPGRLAVVEGKPDRIANLLDEAADTIEQLEQTIANLVAQRLDEL